jgi:hypothetical protein
MLVCFWGKKMGKKKKSLVHAQRGASGAEHASSKRAHPASAEGCQGAVWTFQQRFELQTQQVNAHINAGSKPATQSYSGSFYRTAKKMRRHNNCKVFLI